MALLIGFLIFLFVLFCINYTIVKFVIHITKPKKNEWERSIEKEIKRVLQE